MRITNSELQTYKRCKRKWYLSHERKLAPRIPQVTGTLALGDRVHKALLAQYTPGEQTFRDELRRLYARDNDVLRKATQIVTNDEGATSIAKQLEELQKEHELATIILEGYEQWVADEGVDSDLEIYDLECTLETPLFDGVTLLGKLDQRAFRSWDGARIFRDFKTTGNLTDPAKHLPRDEQALTYMCLEHATAARAQETMPTGRFDVALFTLLRKVKRTARATPPFYGQVEVRHPIHELRRFWLRLKEEVRELLRTKSRIDQGEDPAVVAYPTPKRDCSWDCPFYACCPMFDNGEDAEGYLAEHYEERDPLERYYTEEADA